MCGKRAHYLEGQKWVFEGTSVLTVIYGCKTCAISENIRKRVNVVKIKCWRTICGVIRVD